MKHDLITLDSELPAHTDTLSGRQLLRFRARGERYALPIDNVREISEYQPLTPVPMMPAFVRGVINLRGHVVPVVDLACRFGFGVSEPDKRTCIIIMDVESPDGEYLRFGLLVEAVDSVFDVDNNLEPPPRFGTGLRAEFIAGMIRESAGFTIVLEINQVLSLDDMKQIATAALEAQPALDVHNQEH